MAPPSSRPPLRPRPAPAAPARAPAPTAAAPRRTPAAPQPGRAPASPPIAARPAPGATGATAPRPPLAGAQLKRLVAPFRRKGPDGLPLYSKADRKRMMQLLLVTLIPPGRAAALPPALQGLAGELSAAAGVRRGASGKDSMATLVAHFRQNPPNPALLAEVNAVLMALVEELEGAARLGASTTGPAEPTAAGMAPPQPAAIGVSRAGPRAVPELLERAGVTFMKFGPPRGR